MIIEFVKAKSGGGHYICKCDFCEKEFKQYSTVVKRGYRNYCSVECKKLGRSKYNSGENHPLYGKEHNLKTKEKMAISKIGDKNKRWKGGKFISSLGYVMVKISTHPRATIHGYIQEHILVMENFLGRYLEPQEVVHHINKIKTDNRIENLMLFPNNGEHTKYHKLLIRLLEGE